MVLSCKANEGAETGTASHKKVFESHRKLLRQRVMGVHASNSGGPVQSQPQIVLFVCLFFSGDNLRHYSNIKKKKTYLFCSHKPLYICDMLEIELISSSPHTW